MELSNNKWFKQWILLLVIFSMIITLGSITFISMTIKISKLKERSIKLDEKIERLEFIINHSIDIDTTLTVISNSVGVKEDEVKKLCNCKLTYCSGRSKYVGND